MSDALRLSHAARFAHTCSACLSKVTIAAPTKNGHGDNQDAWNRWRNLVRPQIMWPLLCPTCKAWWNDRLDATDRQAQTVDNVLDAYLATTPGSVEAQRLVRPATSPDTETTP